MAAKILKKITVSSCNATPDVRVLLENAPKGEPPKTVPLLRITGFARKAKPGHAEATDTDYIAFIGQFSATNLQTGETFFSGKCILPGAIPEILYGALGDAGDKEIAFGFDIGAVFDDSAITKYVYVVESLLAPKEDDPLERLNASFKATPAFGHALPAPPPAVALAAPTAAAPAAPAAAPAAPAAAPAAPARKRA